MLPVPSALLDFSLLIIVYTSLYFRDDVLRFSLKLSVIETDVLNISFGLRISYKYSFHLFSTCSICDIILFSETLQFVGNVDCCWLEYFTSSKKFLFHFFYSFIHSFIHFSFRQSIQGHRQPKLQLFELFCC